MDPGLGADGKVNGADASRCADLSAFFRGRPVLVTGADGFIGQNCVQCLHELGAVVSILSRRQRPLAAGLAHRVLRGDMADRELMQEAVQGQQVVIDCAGSTGAVDSNRDAYRNLEIECRPHLNLFEACARESDSPVVVFFSTRLVYGPPLYLPVDETHPVNPQSMYAVHKLTLEHYLRVFGYTQDLPWVVLRLSNPYGPYRADRQRNYGVINQFIRKALLGEPITLYGDGSQKRDYIYIEDVIRTALSCVAAKECHNQILNLGGLQSISLKEAVEVIGQELGRPLEVRQVPWPEEAARIETGDYLTDLGRLNAMIPQEGQLPFKTGVARTLDALREAMND